MNDQQRVDRVLHRAASELSALAARHPVPPSERLREPSRRARWHAPVRRLPVVAGAVVCALVVAGLLVAGRPSVTFVPADDPFAEDVLDWRALPPPPYAPVSGHSITFTGEGVLVWGGVGRVTGDQRPRPRGGAYLDLSGGAWHDPADGGDPRWDHAAVWTGREVLLWGGSTELASGSADGVRVAVPSLGQRAMSPAPVGMAEPVGVWTGDEALFFGQPAVADGAILESPRVLRYEPETDTWATGGVFPGGARTGASVVWTGGELVVWGGLAWDGDRGAPAAVADGYSYDPATDAWGELAPAPLTGRFRHAAAWTGDRMLVWGGAASEEPGDVLADGAVYAPRADSWTVLPAAPVQGRDSAVAAVAGNRVVIAGGQTRRSPGTWEAHDDGAVLSLSSNAWVATFETRFERFADALRGTSAGEAVLLWRGPDGRSPEPAVALLTP